MPAVLQDPGAVSTIRVKKQPGEPGYDPAIDGGDPGTTTTTTTGTGTSTTPTTSGGVTYNMPIPTVDPTTIAQANDAYNRALASVNSRRSSTLTSYGFKATGYDDSGNPLGLEVDPNSMYGQYQQMLDSQARASMSAQDAGQSRGFTGGLANQAASGLNYQQGADRLTLGSNLLGEFSGEEQDLLSAQAQRDAAITAAYQQAALLAAEQGYWTPVEEPSDPGTGDGGGGEDDPTSTKTTTTKKTTTPAPKQTAAAKKLAQKVVAKAVTANKTGATASKARGVISIH